MPKFANIPVSKNFVLLRDYFFKFRFITTESFSLLSRTTKPNSYNQLERFVKFNFLNKHDLGAFKANVYIPTLLMKNTVLENFAEANKYIVSVAKLKHTNIRHDYFLQLEFLNNYDIYDAVPMPYSNSSQENLAKIPDFLVKNNNDTVAIELENTIKSKVRINLFFVTHSIVMNNTNLWNKVHIIATNNQIYNAYTKFLKLDKFMGVRKIDGAYVVDDTLKPLPFSEQVKNKFKLTKTDFCIN